MKKLILILAFIFYSGVAWGAYIDPNTKIMPSTNAQIEENSVWSTHQREAGRELVVTAAIGGTGAQTVNVFEFTGTVRVLDQWAEIISVTTLTNLTNMYADVYDGTRAIDLTADGAVLSNCPVGTFFTRDKVATQTYSVSCADEVRMNENLADRKVGLPFTITAENGATNYIRFHYTTTDNPVAFTLKIHFVYVLYNGATLTEVTP